MEPGDERERLGAQNFVLPAAGLGVDLDAGYSRMRCHEGLRKGVGRSETHVLDLFSAFVESVPSIRPRDWFVRRPSARAKPRRLTSRLDGSASSGSAVASLTSERVRPMSRSSYSDIRAKSDIVRRAAPTRAGQVRTRHKAFAGSRLYEKRVNHVRLQFEETIPRSARSSRRWKSFNLGMIISGRFSYGERH